MTQIAGLPNAVSLSIVKHGQQLSQLGLITQEDRGRSLGLDRASKGYRHHRHLTGVPGLLVVDHIPQSVMDQGC
jgi:hypothetical protein